jgi:hypothetical protein
MKYELVIRSLIDPEYRHVISESPTKTGLHRTEDGVNINLNHEEFFTKIEEKVTTTWKEIQAEAEHVISLAKDDQYLGGQQLADMVLNYDPKEEN